MDYITYEQVKEGMEKYGYIATEDLTWKAVEILNKFLPVTDRQKGQDISAICLEGPPGSGKTEFAKIIMKLSRDMLQNNCAMVEYQCDPTTGKENLFEDIRITAVIQNDPTRAIIDGALVQAIRKVNEGKQVILFLDEYDKAREETDAFLLQFLQSGKLSATQTDASDCEITKPEFKKNLQVILCKNKNRDRLSEPLERRLKIIRLQPMSPTVFRTVALRNFPAEVNLVNFVSMVYDIMYDNKDKLTRIPSCSELLIAIEDAKNYSKWNAPNHIVYRAIMNNMVKVEGDDTIFLSLMKQASKNMKGSKINLDEVFNPKTTDTPLPSVMDIVKEEVLAEYKKEYQEKFAEINSIKEKYIDGSQVKITDKLYLEGELDAKVNIQSNYKNEKNSKRGVSVFSGSENWNLVASMSMDKIDVDVYHNVMKELISKNPDLVSYENGYRFSFERGSFNLNMCRIKNEKNENKINFYVDNIAIPAKVFNEICICIYRIIDDAIPKDAKTSLKVDTVVYNKSAMRDMEKIIGDLYKFSETFTDAKEATRTIAAKVLKSASEWNIKDLDKAVKPICDEIVST